MTTFLWALAAYLCGSLPCSVWLGHLLLGKEIRRFGDGNPGGANVFRAGGRGVGVLAVFLDGLKGLAPVLFAQQTAGLEGWPLAAVALAAVLGHAFSIFLRFRGGKAVAVTFGVWAGLSGWSSLFVLGGLLLVAYLGVSVDGWAVTLTMCGLLIYLVAAGPTPTVLAVWLGNILIVAWKHRLDLARRPEFRPYARGR